MGHILLELASNRIIQSTVLSYFTANFLKVALLLITRAKFDIMLFIKTGGMPSSHSATVSAMAASIYLLEGASNLFILSLVFSIVVVYDAMGIRRAAGKQAALLNKVIEEFQTRKFKAERLYELLGHTPAEVFIGYFLGIIVANAVFML